MAEHEIVVLSSSPLPSLEDIIPRKGRAQSYFDSQASVIHDCAPSRPGVEVEKFAAHRKSIPSGSRASAIPGNAVTGFQTASLLPRVPEVYKESLADPKKKRLSPDDAPRPRRKPAKAKHIDPEGQDNTATLSFKTTKPKPVKVKKAKVDVVTGETAQVDGEAGAKKKRGRPRSAAPDTAEKVVKPKTKASRKTVIVSTFFEDGEQTRKDSGMLATVDLTNTPDSPVTRKKAWTPPRDLDEPIHPEQSPNESSVAGAGLNLLEKIKDLGYEDILPSEGRRVTPAPMVTAIKRKRIDLLPTAGITEKTRIAGKAATVSPRKRMTTITEHALDKFNARNEPAVGDDDMPLTIIRSVADPQKDERSSIVKQPAKKSRRITTKAKAEVQRGKKSGLLKHALTTPRSAGQRLIAQEHLFGTSSQLATADSPNSVKQLQRILQASAAAVLTSVEEAPRRFRFANINTTKHSSLLEAAYSSTAQQSWQDEVTLENFQQADKAMQVDSFLDDDSVSEKPPSSNKDLEPAGPMDTCIRPCNDATHCSSPKIDAEQRIENEQDEFQSVDDFQSVEIKTAITITDEVINVDPVVEKAAAFAKDNFETTLQATAQKGARGRPRKKLSESSAKCKKQVRTTKSKVQSKTVVKSPKAKQKKVSAKTKKKQVTGKELDEFQHVDDILDSEPETSESPRGLKTKELELSNKSPAKPKRIGKLDNFELIKPELFSNIKKAVLDSSPTHDAQHPSWHERILMYDPIILEDFTAWLNSEGVRVASGKEGEEPRELEPWIVGKWCEENSICCLWKMTNRNTLRSMR